MTGVLWHNDRDQVSRMVVRRNLYDEYRHFGVFIFVIFVIFFFNKKEKEQWIEHFVTGTMVCEREWRVEYVWRIIIDLFVRASSRWLNIDETRPLMESDCTVEAQFILMKGKLWSSDLISLSYNKLKFAVLIGVTSYGPSTVYSNKVLQGKFLFSDIISLSVLKLAFSPLLIILLFLFKFFLNVWLTSLFPMLHTRDYAIILPEPTISNVWHTSLLIKCLALVMSSEFLIEKVLIITLPCIICAFKWPLFREGVYYKNFR